MEGRAPSSEKQKPPAVRRLRLGDVLAVSDIALRSPGAALWAPSDYERAASGEYDGWVAEKKSQGSRIRHCAAAGRRNGDLEFGCRTSCAAPRNRHPLARGCSQAWAKTRSEESISRSAGLQHRRYRFLPADVLWACWASDEQLHRTYPGT